MFGINRVIITCRIVSDPVLKNLDANTCVTRFPVAFSNPKGSNGQETTSFINVTAWNSQANNVCKYMKKGSLIAVDGYLRQNKYTKEDGTVVSSIELVASSIVFLDSKNKNDNDNINVSESNNNKEKEDLDKDDLNIDELPF